MLLSSKEIEQAVKSKEISIDPFDGCQLKPASYVIQFGKRWRTWKMVGTPIDLMDEIRIEGALSDIFEQNEFVIENGGFCLAASLERISLPANIAAFISPLSHLARFGIRMNGGAILVSPGFGAVVPTQLTLEITSSCPSPLRLCAGYPAAHLIFMHVSEGTEMSKMFQSIYEGQDVPAGPSLAAEWHKYKST